MPRVACQTKKLLIHGAMEILDRTDHMYVYGSDQEGIQQLIKEFPELGEKLHPRLAYLKAEVIWAVRFEMARTVEDILARRVRALFLDARAAIEMTPLVASMLAKELDKNKDWEEEQIKDFTKTAHQYIL